VLIATSLSAIVMAGVLSSVLMLSRSGYLLNNYIDMENQARTSMETIAVDVRMAKDIVWTRASDTSAPTGFTLKDISGNLISTYSYNSSAGTLTRTKDTASVLITGIQSLTFSAYKYSSTGPELMDPTSPSYPIDTMNNLTKMVQVSLSSKRSRTTLVDATNNVVSARYVLRNKSQTN